MTGDAARPSAEVADELSAEDRLVLSLSRAAFEPPAGAGFPTGIDWVGVAEASVSHRVAPTVLGALEELGWDRSVPATAVEILRSSAIRSQTHTARLLDELDVLLHHPDLDGVDMAVLRGPVMRSLSRLPDSRLFVDIDLVIRRSDARHVDAALRHLGWAQGNVDRESGAFVPLSPAEAARRSGDKTLPAYLKMTPEDGRPLVLEPHLNLFAAHQPWDLPSERLLDASAGTSTLASMAGMPTLSAEAFAIELLIHACNHARALHAVRANADLQLYRSTDVMVLLRALDDDFSWDALWRWAEAWGVELPVTFGLELVRALYDPSLPSIDLPDDVDLAGRQIWYFSETGNYEPVFVCRQAPWLRLFTRQHVEEVLAWQATASLDETRVRDPHRS